MQTPSTHDEPRCTMHHWILVESRGNFFITGYLPDEITLRRSTPIISFDAESLTCRTRSGRRYELLKPYATDDLAKRLLAFFFESTGVEGIDATLSLLNDPDRIYKTLIFFDATTGKVQPAAPLVEAMMTNPSEWLSELIETLVAHDIDPFTLKNPLGLSPAEWQLQHKNQLTSVSAETAFRGCILRQIIDMTFVLVSTTTEGQLAHSSRRQNLVNAVSIYDMHALRKQHHDLLLTFVSKFPISDPLYRLKV